MARTKKIDRDATPRCLRCGRPIFWGITTAGKKIPLDQTPAVYLVVQRQNTKGLVERALNGMVIHFATCAGAKRSTKKEST